MTTARIAPLRAHGIPARLAPRRFAGARAARCAVLGALALLGACTHQRPQGFAATLPPPPPLEATIAPPSGAIFAGWQGFAPLHAGLRAGRVGDLVTVVLTERTQSSKSSQAASSRNGRFDVVPPALGPFSIDPGNLNSGASGSFNGSGDASQTNQLNGAITVAIAEVMPGGVARIRGEKLMMLSQGEEWIQLSGLIRLVDIDVNNTIASTRVADAHIAYSGSGHFQRASRPGWLAQFFNTVSPF